MEYNKYDKNGSHKLAIYCFACSGNDHHNMKGNEKSKGYAIVFSKHMFNKIVVYDLRTFHPNSSVYHSTFILLVRTPKTKQISQFSITTTILI